MTRTTRLLSWKEREIFDKFIAQHPKGHFLQTSSWGMVKKTTGWEPRLLLLEEDGAPTGAIMLLKRRIPLPGMKRCIYYAPRGPVIDIHNLEKCQALFAGVKRIAKQDGAIFLKIDPDVPASDEDFRRILQRCGFRRNDTGLDFEGVQPGFVFRMDIRPDEEELLTNMHAKTRYNIRLAERKGVTVKLAEKKDDLKTFYTILTETAQRDHFLIRDYAYFESIWDQMAPAGYAKIFLVESPDGEAIAGSLLMHLGDKAWYLYGASSNAHRNLMPNYLMQWKMIQWSKAHHCTLYDFRGVSGDITDENNPLYGLYRFKKGFGGELTEFIGDWDCVYSPFFYRLWTQAMPQYKAFLHKRAQKKKNRSFPQGTKSLGQSNQGNPAR